MAGKMSKQQVYRLAAGVKYDGTRFAGWQRQKDQKVRFVQEELERALSSVADQPVTVVCAGRTDTGVHATGQVVHFETSAFRPDRSWLLGTNVNLPGDVCLRWVQPVAGDFHARFSATARRYRYIIDNRPVRPAVLRGKVTWWRAPLDVERMARAAASLTGEHDFTSYRSQACQAKNPVREIRELSVTRQGDFIHIDVEANAFLHHMVRNIAGVLMAIGEGERPVAWAEELLEVRDRTRGGITAPAAGLYLVAVRYPERFNLPDPPPPPAYAGG